jgi:hypothetical protein
MLMALEKLHEHALFVHKVESAARGFLYGNVRRGFMTWAGLRQEKLVHQQQVVWLAVQRGHRVGALQEMFEEITPSVIEELIQMKDAQGTTPLLWASKRGFGDIVEVLLAFSSDLESVVGARDADGCCPLHHAARRHHNEIVAMLLDAGADVHAKNSVDKSTALHWAARKDNGVAIQMLLEAGADREAQNSWGATPLDNALFAKCWRAVQLLATDAETLRAAAEELAIERIVRPTAEERHEKLAKLAMNTMVQRENRRQKLEAQHQAREQQQATRHERQQDRQDGVHGGLEPRSEGVRDHPGTAPGDHVRVKIGRRNGLREICHKVRPAKGRGATPTGRAVTTHKVIQS